MACSDHSELYQFWSHGQFFDGVNCYYANQIGEPATQFIVFSTLALSLYAYSREPITVLVPGAIFAVVFIAPLPSNVVNTAVLFGIIATAMVLFVIIWRLKGGIVG